MGLLYYCRALLRTGTPVALLEIDSPAHTFTAMVTLLRMYAEVDSLAALVRNTREVLSLIIKLWVFEIWHTHLSTQLAEMFRDSYPPTSAGLLHFYLFTRRDPDSYSAMLDSALEGSLGRQGIALVALEHIRRNTVACTQYQKIPVENMRTNLLNLTCLHSTPLHSLLLSQNSVRIVTEALVVITSAPFDSANAETTADCVQQICEYLHKYIASDGLNSLNQSLEVGLLVGLLKAHPWLSVKKSAFDVFTALLAAHVPRYFIYISVLRQVHKSIDIIQQLGLKDAMPEVCLEVWHAFEKYAGVRLNLASAAELGLASCRGSECSEPSSMRCSGCWEAAYCSKACQMAAWSTHGAICTARMHGRQNGIPPDLGEEDIQFALRVAQHDFEENKAAICAKWTDDGKLPISAGIDYSMFPPTVGIDPPSVVREQMSSDAAIYTILPQGTTEKEYYMCDLGLTRGAGDPDDETIKVVIQMVGTQPVPAFFRVN
ncbi:hypothetical protein DFH07DRAFT_817492 [Mycena maculata]|uniref:MYND-type domain-containing protein n=1 Tax=Mycena maculata TaxID=230809 RepID=A0AAD7NGL8_9AGAR|nr:hypothetical protein DFH07DRAFT_817492 [Mycena maculata]